MSGFAARPRPSPIEYAPGQGISQPISPTHGEWTIRGNGYAFRVIWRSAFRATGHSRSLRGPRAAAEPASIRISGALGVREALVPAAVIDPTPTLREMASFDPSRAPRPGPSRRLAGLRVCSIGAHPRPSLGRGIVFRSVTPKYARSADLLSGAGSRRVGGRWNPPGHMNAVYASLDAESAMREVLSHYRDHGIPEHEAMPRVSWRTA